MRFSQGIVSEKLSFEVTVQSVVNQEKNKHFVIIIKTINMNVTKNVLFVLCTYMFFILNFLLLVAFDSK